MPEHFLLVFAAALSTYLLVPPVRRLALGIGATPEVRDRDVHTTPIPRLGGLAMYAGLLCGLYLAVSVPMIEAKIGAVPLVTAFAVAGGVIVVVGFFDDLWGVDAFLKLGGQAMGAGILVHFDIRLKWIPWLDGTSYTLDTTLSAIVTVGLVVIVINAVNFIDGLDGLAAGVVAISAACIWLYSIILQQSLTGRGIVVAAVIAAALLGVCLGFLPHNFHPSRIFMGDTGSMLIGLTLAAAMISVTSDIPPEAIKEMNRFPIVLPVLLPIAVMALPLLDLLSAVIRRTSYGRSPFAPDRAHLHHRLLDIGNSHRRTVVIMYAWTALLGISTVTLAAGGVPVVVFPITVLIAITILALMAAPRWNRTGRHAAPTRPR
ncbi:MraY family glycosyltransferase [Sinosporangium siamense]|uniref:Undecaprenyl-phosphate alpha-N-acetylglucosaminyl 1-phosphate transferase n=1 Tax=Sinosporangium siamense TaxID=1367973 RepID=A0A919RCY0_9ACTN|nr:MraY family glycosyltransferase [Sinosporangium siamense]GII91626.1 undecaprenyl-phosphate alpha-N-acetylglucosaminyl 1-phosphate transferase [Sinosporangium siamense]